MALGSSIEWTQATWNPVTGCTRVSAGCDHCYAARMTRRLEAMGCAAYAGLTSRNRRGELHFNGRVRCHEDRLDLPRRWREPRLVFVNSMSDLFHKDVPLAFIQQVFKVMNECRQHTFQVLTKRPEIAAAHAPKLRCPSSYAVRTGALRHASTEVDAVDNTGVDEVGFGNVGTAGFGDGDRREEAYRRLPRIP